MNQEIKICQQCAVRYEITPDDFAFYEKMGVPAPVMCPICRFKRRAIWRNEMTLYSRVCALCGKSTLSMYHPKSPYTIYCNECWLSDRWDPNSYATDYDPKRPFFEQFGELMRRVPKAGVHSTSDVGPNIRSEYTNFAGGNKDCYMLFNSGPRNENCSYGRGMLRCRDAVDIYYGDDLERSYETVNVHRSSGIVWGQNVTDSVDSWYVLNCSGVNNCFGCVNLRQKSYHFLNEPLPKEEWTKRVADIKGSYKNMEAFRKRFDDFSLKFPRRENNNLKNINAVGNYIIESKNCVGFELSFCEDCRHLFFVKQAKDSYDLIGHGRRSELLLEGVAVGVSQRVIGGWWVAVCHDVEYSFAARNSEYCFGCDSVRDAKFSILNKQYSETEYRKLRDNIINELRAKNLYGLYFPPEIAPFAYNETIAQDNIPLSQEEAINQGFRWQDDFQMTSGKTTMSSDAIPDHIKDIPDTVTKEIFACVECGRNYRTTPAELQFYKTMVVPVPRRCFFCRHLDRLHRRGPMTLYDRACAKCEKSIKTNFAPDRPEIVYCESCYQQEVA